MNKTNMAVGVVLLTLLTPIIALAEGEALGKEPLVQVNKPIFCGDSSSLLKYLTEKYNEVPVVIFNEQNGMESQVVVFANVEKGTASVVENFPNGKGCLLATGHDVMICCVINIVQFDDTD
jgi:hypothetical protein